MISRYISAARLILQIRAKYFSMYTEKSFNILVLSHRLLTGREGERRQGDRGGKIREFGC